MIYSLPYPPSMNSYWRQFRGRAIISAAGRQFRTNVMAAILSNGKPDTMQGPVRVQIEARPPDRRRRDLDNILKPLLDALQHSGVYQDDSQIDELHIKRGPLEPHGEVIVIAELIRF